MEHVYPPRLVGLITDVAVCVGEVCLEELQVLIQSHHVARRDSTSTSYTTTTKKNCCVPGLDLSRSGPILPGLLTPFRSFAICGNTATEDIW